MTLQEKIQKKAERYGKLAPVFLEGAKFVLENQWISVDDDLPCNHSDLVLTYNGTPFITKSVLVTTGYHTLFICNMKKDDIRGWIWNISIEDEVTHWMPIHNLPKE